MIGKLRGVVDEVMADGAVIDVGGVGYSVHLGARGSARLGGSGDDVEVYIHTHVREESLDLYGFPSRADLSTFQLLLGVSGVGPRMAMAILDTLDADGVRRALATGDGRALARSPGVGKKTAERLILELGDRAGEMLDLTVSADASTEGAVTEAVEALGALGFGRSEAVSAVGRARQDGDPNHVEDLVRRALAFLSDEGGGR